ncbi:hypothetical protein Enr10x_32010 [Gimesia panareensis]|uniref:Nucleoside 2-deoxyribosyltransferase n=1 Tax=Gimesia panareensis TaxID=2527978 RepID=A0A517Q8B3_9PLAN|nr:hypothetical protein [Gimesia panareensis]QDT27866.1 hypothetical protein Enr10x_32010 [Gimesia panareensis]
MPQNQKLKQLEARLLSLEKNLIGKDMVILIWGPGKKDKNYSKREDIKRELQQRFPEADVFFSEEKQARKQTRNSYPSLIDEELAHATAADIIFALDTSKGVGEEISVYSEYSQIRGKLIVLSHVKYRRVNTFPAALRRCLHLEYYSDEDYSSCNIAKKICTKHVNAFLLRRIAERGSIQ